MNESPTVIYCQKLKKELPALPKPPIPGALGHRIHQHISKEAWSLWLKHQTILINEHRLKLNDPEARKRLMVEMEKFLFESSIEAP